ncbi:acyltransferase family protein [Secundilactobacillus paracollinoides]|uniref:acyltransferase family protein n=1 Tax=Secundilactobacillus paracollinoides TaxID=240427 RepID=UPI00384B1C40
MSYSAILSPTCRRCSIGQHSRIFGWPTKGELIVTTFLFFSGYGVMVQLQKRGPAYLETFPVKRILFTWLKFAVAVTIYLVLSVAMAIPFPPGRIVLAYLGLATIGNSSWYIFAILLMYALTYVAFKLAPGQPSRAIILLFIGTSCYLVIAVKQLPPWYAETIFSYLGGVLFARYHEPIEKRLTSSWGHYWLPFLWTFSLFCGFYILCAITPYRWLFFISYQFAAICFPLLFVFLAMKTTIRAPFYRYVGGTAMFSIYMLQRLPMILGRHTVLAHQPVRYFCFVLVSTLFLGWVFDQLVGRFLQRLVGKRASVSVK